MVKVRRLLSSLLFLVVIASPVVADQKFIDGVFMQTETGTPIEMISWALLQSNGSLKMDHGFLEDAPTVPRTYRLLVNLGTYDVTGVIAVNMDIFKESIDRLNRRALPHSVVRLGVRTFEVGVPELENWDRVQRLRKALKANEDKPMICFLVVTNGANTRYYPFFVDRRE